MRPELKLVGQEQQGNLLDGVVSDPVLEVFEYWKVLMDKQRSQLGHARKEKIHRALAIGYTVDDLKLAIVGCKYDAWSQGQNKNSMRYDDVELICRDEVRIDRFIELGQEYMRRAQASDEKKAEQVKDAAERVKMPDYVRAKLDALFSKYKKGGA